MILHDETIYDVVKFLYLKEEDDKAERVIQLIEELKLLQGRLEFHLLQENEPILKEVK